MSTEPTSNSSCSLSDPAPDTDHCLPGIHRNFLWRILQLFVQVFVVCWFRFRARGHEHIPANSGALLVINHQSYLDPVLVGVSLKRPVSFVARDSLFKVPVIGWILKNTYVLPINRDRAGSDVFRNSIERLKSGYLLGVFPEGTRSSGDSIGKLKPGFIALARRSKLPIIPVGISGAYRAMPRGSLFIWPSKIRVYFGEPLAADRVQELTQKGREPELLEWLKEELAAAVSQAANS